MGEQMTVKRAIIKWALVSVAILGVYLCLAVIYVLMQRPVKPDLELRILNKSELDQTVGLQYRSIAELINLRKNQEQLFDLPIDTTDKTDKEQGLYIFTVGGNRLKLRIGAPELLRYKGLLVEIHKDKITVAPR